MRSAQNRLPCGTTAKLLNAAWFPTWHGSQPPIAQDQFLNTELQVADHTSPTLVSGYHPCYSGFQVQGSATSPAGMALLYGLSVKSWPIRSVYVSIPYFFTTYKSYFKFSLIFSQDLLKQRGQGIIILQRICLRPVLYSSICRRTKIFSFFRNYREYSAIFPS